jgi:ABC-type Fe3+/spermidine/putrescine transport system ATPase subunit
MDIQEKTGTTFVIVTHDQEEAMTVASRVAVMDEGRIVQVATPQVIYEAPSSVYVADFIGDVNLIRGIASARPTAPATPEKVAEPEPVAAAPEPEAVAPEPKSPAQTDPKPQPNAIGEWLHDTLLTPILGPRDPAPRALPAPTDEERATHAETAEISASPAEDIPEGGLQIVWDKDKPPLIAANGDEAMAGRKVVLALRPEKVGISKTRPDAPNAMQGKVIDIAYLGNISTYHVELPGGAMIKAQTANTRRIARRDITWEDDVWLSFSATAGVVLEDDS